MGDLLDSLDLDKEFKLGIVCAFVSEHINKKLFGEIMAIADTSSKDSESRRAMKSLISQAFTRNTKQMLSSINELNIKEV